MNIGFYSEATNLSQLSYRGVYRQNNIIDLYSKKSSDPILVNAIDWYFSISKEGVYVENAENEFNQLISLYKIVRSKNWEGDFILFTDEFDVNNYWLEDFKFIGYDIIADSKYYSPIGDGFLTEYNNNALFFADMSYEEYNKFKNDLNDSGLFSSYDIALKFSQYCCIINKKHEHVIESENNWRPFAIYCFNT